MKEARGNYLTVAGVKSFNNGDGVCYLDENGKLQGFRINRVENNKLFPQEMPRIKPRTLLYRNFDQEFDRQMQRKSAERKLSVVLVLAENNFVLSWANWEIRLSNRRALISTLVRIGLFLLLPLPNCAVREWRSCWKSVVSIIAVNCTNCRRRIILFRQPSLLIWAM